MPVGKGYEELFAEVAQRRVGTRRIRLWVPALLVLLFVLGISLTLWYLTKERIESEQRALFERSVSSVVSRLQQRYRDHERVLRSLQALYGSFVHVVRDIFELYAAIPVRQSSAVLTIGYAPCVEASRLGAFLHYARSERFYDYRLRPPVIVDSLLFPLLYVVPTDSAPEWVGWNAATDPPRRAAIVRAYTEGRLTATPWMPLRTTPDTVWGFVLVAPLYRSQPHAFAELQTAHGYVEGVLLMEIDGRRFINSAFSPPAPTDSLIVLECYDVVLPAGKRQRIAQSPNRANVPEQFTPVLAETQQLVLADRALELLFATVPQFGRGSQRWVPWLVLGGGVLTSFIAFGFVLSLVSTRARAVALAEQMTRAQRRILEASHDIIAVWSADGLWRSVNPAIRATLGYVPEQLLGTAVEALVVPSARASLQRAIREAPDEQPFLLELPMQSAHGEERWIGWNLTRSAADGLIYAIGRDITAQKELQRRQLLTQRQLQLSQQWALAASEFKTDFVRRLGFQLRNGLTGLLGFAQLLAERQYSTEEEAQEYAHAIQESAEYLFSLVAESLEGEEPPLEQPTQPIAPILTQLADELARQRPQARLSVHGVSEELSTPANAELLHQALQALLLGICPQETPIELSCRIESNLAEGSAEWTITAPATDLVQRALELMRQASPLHALEQDDTGTVFQLLLAQALIERLHSRLSIESVDSMLVAVFTLPIQRQFLAAAAQPHHPSARQAVEKV